MSVKNFKMNVGEPVRVLTQMQATPDSFHDCYVYGFGWNHERYNFNIDLDYIVEWLEPCSGSEGYRFSVSLARLTFRNADDVVVSLNWTKTALICQIDAIRIAGSRTTPGGANQSQYILDFSEPDGHVALWSTDYELALFHEPLVSDAQSIRLT